MEATGTYCKPVWAVLEDDFSCGLVNARDVKQVPGRQTDVKDAEWLCQRLEAGLLKACLVPPKPIRALRNLTRYRKSLIRDRQREANRLHKVIQETGIKLDCVASDLLGKSGRAMLDALVSGTTNPEVVADLALGRLRTKIPQLREALEGRLQAEHKLVIGRILAPIDFLNDSIDQLSSEIEEHIRPFASAVDLLQTIPGVGRSSKQPNPPPEPSTPTYQPNTHASEPDAAPTARASRSRTRSSPPPGTCSQPARSTTTSAATTSPDATPNQPPDDS
jgi:transposase